MTTHSFSPYVRPPPTSLAAAPVLPDVPTLLQNHPDRLLSTGVPLSDIN